MRRNVLISSAGRRVALVDSFRSAMSGLGLEDRVLASDVSPLSAAFHRADAGYLVPRCTESAFVPTLLELYTHRENIGLVVPTIDTELPMLAAHREEFSALGTTVAVSSPEVVAIGSDKRTTHEWLLAHGFPTVRQSTVREALEHLQDWPLPLVVKPARGSASIGVEIVESRGRLASMSEASDLIVQTVASGEEHTVDVFVDRAGQVKCAVPRRRLETRGGEVSKGVTVASDALVGLASQLVAALPGAAGVLNVQVFVDRRAGTSEVIEINARFGGGFPLAREAGADFTRWLLEDLHGLPSTAGQASWKPGVVMLRYDDAVFVDAAGVGLTPVTARFDLVVFDIDDTLYLERDYVRSGFQAVEQQAAGSLPEGFADRAWGLFEAGRRGDIFDAALEGSGVDAARIGDLVAIYRQHTPAIVMLPDATGALQRAIGAGLVAVVTDGPIASQRAKARVLGVEDVVDLIVFTEELGAGYGKPHQRAFEALEASTGIHGRRAVYVADNPAKDFGGPRALGWTTVRVRRPGALHASIDSGDDVDEEITDLDRFLRASTGH